MANEILYVPGVGTRYFYNKNTLGTVSLDEIGSSNWTSQLVDGHPCFALSGTAFKFTTGSAFTGSHTVEYWLKLDGWANTGTAHVFGNSGFNNFYGVAPAVVSGGNNISLKLYFDFDGSSDQATTVTLPSQSGWVHIAAVYEYNTPDYKVNVYVNGTKVAEHYLQLMGSMRLMFGGSVTADSDTALNDAFTGKMANIIVTSGLKYTGNFTPAWDEVDVSGLAEGGDKMRNFTAPEIEYLDAGNVPYKIAVKTDDTMSATSENPVQNRVVKAALDAKQDPLTAGDNITLKGNVISASYPKGGVANNGYYEEKNLGTWASVSDVETFLAKYNVAAGNFGDLKLGNYVTIQDGTYNKAWMIAGFDVHYNVGDTALTTHHIALVPRNNLLTAQMNSSDTTAGGYKGSNMYKTTIPAVVTNLNKVLGSHLLTHRRLLTKGINTSAVSGGAAFWTGASSDWEWTEVRACLMTEPQVYGTRSFSSSAFDVGEGAYQLPVFKFMSHVKLGRETFWLRAVASSSRFCSALLSGAGVGTATSSYGVRPLILVG